MATAVALGSGQLPKAESARILSAWQRAAGMDSGRQRIDVRGEAGRVAVGRFFTVETVERDTPAEPLADMAGYRERIRREREAQFGRG